MALAFAVSYPATAAGSPLRTSAQIGPPHLLEGGPIVDQVRNQLDSKQLISPADRPVRPGGTSDSGPVIFQCALSPSRSATCAPQYATDNGGEILMVYESDVAVSYGDLVTLPDGTSWPVVGFHKIVTADGVIITAHIGDTFP